jgi:ABC-2 type transport system permease protein
MNIVRIYRQGLIVGLHDFARTWTWQSWLFGWMMRIGTTLMMWVLLGRMLGSPAKLQYLLIGNGVLAGPLAAAWVVGGVNMDRFDGVYPLQVIAPASLLPALVGRSSVWFMNGIVTSMAAFALLAAVFGFDISLTAAALLPLFLTLISASSYCLMLFFGALTTLAPRLRNAVLGGSGTLLMALCGVAVPVSFWPGPVQVFANLLPVTHGLQAVRVLIAGGPAAQILTQLGLELLVGAGWLALSMATIDRMADTGRANGSIEFA